MSSTNNTPSLFTMAIRNAIRNVDQIDSVGDLPYDMVEPILRHIKSPQQLRELEETSPHIKAHSKNLWLAFISRDIPRSQNDMITPKNPLNWGSVYRYMLRRDLKLQEEQEEKLKKEMLGLVDKKEQATFLPQVVKHASAQRNFIDGNPNPNKRHQSWGGPQVPTVKNARPGQFIAALQREARDAQAGRALAARHAKGEKTRFIPSAKSQIKTAPYDMLANHQKPKASDAILRSVRLESSSPHKTGIFAPSLSSSKVTAKDRALSEAEARERRIKEDRLRALARPGSKSAALASPTKTANSTSLLSNVTDRSAPSQTVSETLSSRNTHSPAISAVTSRRNPALVSTSSPSSRSSISAGAITASLSSPRPASKATPAHTAVTSHGRPMATAKSRINVGSTRVASSRSDLSAINPEPVEDSVKQTIKSDGRSSAAGSTVPLPMIRKRAPAKLFINHAPKRVKP